MTFSWDRAWSDAVSMARAHIEILLVVAGLFMLLPAFAVVLYLPQPPLKAFDDATMRAWNAYFASNWFPLLLANIVTWMGQATILALLLNSRRQMVSQSLRGAVTLLFPFAVLNLITELAVFAGGFALIVPGIYLFGRLAVAGPAMLAERTSNPLDAIARSLSLSRGKGWRIAGLVIFVWVVMSITTGALKSAIAVLLVLVVSTTAIVEVTALLSALLDASVSLVTVVLAAAIYRQLVSERDQRKNVFS